jgi:DNA repair photolyase
MNKTFLSVCFTITTTDDDLASKIEPKAPSPSKRLEALDKLIKSGIYAGVLFQPILPFLLDTEENICSTIQKVADTGAKFIIPWFAVTMRQGQREYFLDKLAKDFPEVKDLYVSNFQNQYVCKSPKAKKLFKLFEDTCRQYQILYKMQDIQNFQKLNPYKQLSLFDMVDTEKQEPIE